MRALITWLTESKGGRKALPAGLRYVTVARFPEDGENWTQQAWSVVATFSIPPSEQGSPSTGDVRFLVDEAPRERIAPDRHFDLYEGGRRVAVVQVLGEHSTGDPAAGGE